MTDQIINTSQPLSKPKWFDEIHNLMVKADKAGGLILPNKVVDWAKKHPNSQLHERFDWNDTSAGHKYRIEQARRLLRVSVRLEDAPNRAPTRVTVSFIADRVAGGGYRLMGTVMTDAQHRSELLHQAWKEFRAWERRYKDLQELAAIFEAADESEDAA